MFQWWGRLTPGLGDWDSSWDEMGENTSLATAACCAFPNQSLTIVTNSSPASCRPLPDPQDLWEVLQWANETSSLFDHWYNHCFEPMVPPPITWSELLPSLTVYSVIFALGVLGNLLIILTVMQKSSFKSPTNTFLASLASTDLLLILICTPIKLYRLFAFTWHLGEAVCKITFYVQDMSVICSVLNLTAMSLERFYAVVYPLKARQVCTVSQARRVVAGTWLLAAILALPRNWIQVHYQIGNKKDGFHFWCIPNWEERGMWKIFQLYMMAIVVVMPTIMMTFAYTAISRAVMNITYVGVRDREADRNSSYHGGTASNREEVMCSSLQCGSEVADGQQQQQQTAQRKQNSQEQLSSLAPGLGPSQVQPGQQLYVLPAKPAHIKRFASLRLTHKSWRSPSQQQQDANANGQRAQAPVQLRANYSRGRNGQGRIGRRWENCEKLAREKAQIRKVVPMLAMVVLVFLLCWSPILVFELLQSFDIVHWWITGGLKHAKTCFSLLAYFNSCINPVIYGFMSRNFRQSFSEALCSCRFTGNSSTPDSSGP